MQMITAAVWLFDRWDNSHNYYSKGLSGTTVMILYTIDIQLALIGVTLCLV